jgi:hypothetical protein
VGLAGAMPASMTFSGPVLESIFYVLVSALAPLGFGLPGALDAVPVDARVFFLPALGFLGSQLLLF